VLRLLVTALACASFLHAVDPQDHVRRSIPVSSATRLVLKADAGAIRIQPGGTSSVDIDVYFRGFHEHRDFTLDVKQQGSDIRVNGAFRNGGEWWPFFLGGGWLREVEYRVMVPEKFNASVETAGGAISIKDMRGEVEASTSGGGISIERNSGRVRAHTSGGGIEIQDAMGAIDASTSGGGVNASLLGQPNQECRLYTAGGSINVSLSKDIHVDLDASTSGGRVWTDFPVAGRGDRHPSELRTPLNGGGPRLFLHTSGGGISIRRTS
jgi:hypothetical protein